MAADMTAEKTTAETEETEETEGTEKREALIQVSAYRSVRRVDTYIIAPQEFVLDDLPAPLLERLGQPEHVIDFELHPGRHMAQADPVEVIAAIRRQGFYLQLPKQEDE